MMEDLVVGAASQGIRTCREPSIRMRRRWSVRGRVRLPAEERVLTGKSFSQGSSFHFLSSEGACA